MSGGQGRIVRALAVIGALLAGLAAVPATAQEDNTYYGPRLIEERVRIAAPNNRTIAATILRPDGQGPFGAVILNHGVSASARERARESSDLLINAASVFARRGYVVVMPLRRGFGATGGDMAEDPGSCSNPDYMSAEARAADDVMAAYDYARALPYVDGNRMILAGQSAGGMVSVFTAGTRQPQGLQAVLSCAPRRRGDPESTPGVPCAVEPVARVLETVGRSVRVPVLFHYSENDLFFSPKISRGWYERFNANGAKADYVLQPAFGKDGHYLFGDTLGVRYWLPTVETFLAKNNIQFARLDSSDTERQTLLAVDRVPNIKSDACRGLYRAFLESPGPRAYAVSSDGRCGFAGGLTDAREVAIKQCSNVAKSSCLLYAVDDAVIWKESVAGQGAASAPR
jgi:dienelactone hydrolase